MAVALNSYASKAYSEHPIAMWPMDDDSYFLSLIDPSDRFFTNWTLTTASATVSSGKYNNDSAYLPDIIRPFPESDYSTIFMNTSSVSYLLTATSADLFTINDLDLNKKTFCINFFLYQNPLDIQWFKIGYKYTDSLSVEHTIISSAIDSPNKESWINFNYSYDIPNDLNGSVKIFFQVLYNANADVKSRKITMNGLSIGQWSETACYSTLGTYDKELPTSVKLSDITGIVADQYGVLSNNGYYIVENNSVLAQNEGPPLIFGTDNCTKIKHSLRQNPSFIFPGQGLLNESGRNNNYSLEMWIQINPITNISRRIIGPLGNDYGIYVREGFISLLIGDTVLSHSVGQWNRPMLININIKNNIVSLLINGETVISIPYNKSTIELPLDEDWWGVYSYSDIENFKIDCVAIYPYPVSEAVAKRRFVWGQGTTSVQFIDDQFSGFPTTIDFSTAEYTSNIIYPDIAQWNAAHFDNMTATNKSISIPNYSLPTIYLGDRDIQSWYDANKYINKIEYPDVEDHLKFVSFRPNTKSNEVDSYIYAEEYWSNESYLNFSSTHFITNSMISQFGVLPSFETDSVIDNGNNWNEAYYINFPSLNVLTQPIESMYAVFEIENNILQSRPLISFINILTNKKFDISINGQTVIYTYDGNQIYTETINIENHFCVGMNFQLVGQNFGYEIANFFASLGSIQMFVGGDKINTFEGKIYKVGFSSKNNFIKIQSSFNSNGFAKSNDYDLAALNFSSYVLMPLENYNRFSLDISVYSDWEEYYPLSKFAGYVKDINGDTVYDLDFMQLNIDYPTIALRIAWKYNELDALPITYQELKNSNYDTYEDLKNKNTTGETIDTSNSSLQMYITFQDVSQNTIKPLDYFSYTKKLTTSMVIKPDNENTEAEPLKAYNTKFEFKDGVILYPPKTIDFNNIAIVFHFIINQKGIISSPLKINNFEITSKALNANSSNPIGTKFGSKILPYVKTYSASTMSISHKEENPIKIYKRTSPYLYMTNDSGIKVFYNEIENKENLASVPINTSATIDYNVGVVQLWAKYDQESFSSSALPLFEIDSLDKTIQFYTESINDGERAIIKVKDKNNPSASMSDIIFYQNGKFVKNPVIMINEWNCIGILFNEGLSFNGYTGAINLFGYFLFNNVSYYIADGLSITVDVNQRIWDEVYKQIPPSTYYQWSFWSNDTWKDVYILSLTNTYAINPDAIYKTYVGTNRNVIDDDSGFEIGSSAFTTYSSVAWSQKIDKPV